MKETINPIDALYDENNNDNIVLYNDQDEPVEFEQIAVIPSEDKVYVILQPVQPLEGMGEDEALAFEIIKNEKGENSLVLVEEDALIDWIFNEYKKMYMNNHIH